MTLRGRVAVVTGAARGMGRAIVRGLLAEGANVAALDRAWDHADDFAAELARRPDALTITADVTSEADLARAYTATMQRFEGVDVIVNNAGYRQRDVDPSAYIQVLDVPLEQWRRMLEVDTLGPLLVIRQFVGPMLERRSGSIVNISSGSGARGRAGNQPYGAAKAAFTNWSQSLAAELADLNIAVNIVFPTATRTTGYDQWTQLYQQRTGTRPATTFYEPESVVPVVLMLAQQDAHLTGRVFRVDEWNLEHGLGGPEVWSRPAGGEHPAAAGPQPSRQP